VVVRANRPDEHHQSLNAFEAEIKSGAVIQGTAIAIAQGFSGFKTREYTTCPYRAGVYINDQDVDDAEP
jgi:hypothetical protein